MTLTSTGPIVSLPLAYLIKGERITRRSLAGAVMACVGVAVLAAS
jgi:drug/metabolite transporter (DMT)-like permease